MGIAISARRKIFSLIFLPHYCRSPHGSCLLDYLIRPRQHVWGNRETDLLRGFQIDHELKLRRLLYGQFGGLTAFEDLVDISGGTAALFSKVSSIGHQAPVLYDCFFTV